VIIVRFFMQVTVGLFLVLFALAFVCEFIDSSLGMGYGTILSPILIIMGFDPVIAVSAILLSQAVGGFTASVFHHQFANARFSPESDDLKSVFIISIFGIGATVLAAILALNIPRIIMKTYIGILVLIMGIVLLSNIQFKFTWRKMMGLGIFSAFNKGLSGGGFGPVITAGQIISGQKHKGAIAITTLAEAPICTVGFLTYLVGKVIKDTHTPILGENLGVFISAMFSKDIFQWELVLALLLGSVLVAPFGAFVTRIIKTERITVALGVLVTILGLGTLVRTWGFS